MPPEQNNNQPQDQVQLSLIVERLKASNNILVTVSKNPSVDQLAACIGLTIALNKLGKHATAVFSGEVPSTLGFLKPEKTLEKNTDSLRDFIIALDKSKADKLRYKVEDNFVKIFITPYRTSISEKDLEFSQGDFNVESVVALGVHDRSELDAAIVAHGRILHDATVISINSNSRSELGAINWAGKDASSLCEMVTDLVTSLNQGVLDAQISTALLTGLVAETDRFGNEKATPHAMLVSSTLMAAGASTQLIASKLKPPEPEQEIPPVIDDEGEEETPKNDGVIEIDHKKDELSLNDDLRVDEHGKLHKLKDARDEMSDESEKGADNSGSEDSSTGSTPSLVLDPPTLGGQLTANSVPDHQRYSPSTDPMSNAPTQPLLSRDDKKDKSSKIEPSTDNKAEPATQVSDSQTLSDIEQTVGSTHIYQEAEEGEKDKEKEKEDKKDQPDEVPPEVDAKSGTEESPSPPPVDYARDAVERAAGASGTYRPEPIAALNATPVDLNLGQTSQNQTDDANGQDEEAKEDEKGPSDEKKSDNPPPPVPPPMMPPV